MEGGGYRDSGGLHPRGRFGSLTRDTSTTRRRVPSRWGLLCIGCLFLCALWRVLKRPGQKGYFHGVLHIETVRQTGVMEVGEKGITGVGSDRGKGRLRERRGGVCVCGATATSVPCRPRTSETKRVTRENRTGSTEPRVPTESCEVRSTRL